MRVLGGIVLMLLIAGGLVWAALTRDDAAHVPLAVPDLADVTRDEMTFQSDGLTLSGEVFVPAEPKAVAVIIQGSGESRRGNPWYLQVVAALTEAGVAVLLPDKRGSDGSEGDWRTASYEALARDAQAAMAAISARYPGLPLTLIGMSQGGRIAPLAADGRNAPDRIVSLSGGVLPAFDSLVFEEENTLVQIGLPRGLARLIAPLTAWHLREVRHPVFWAAVGNFDPLDHWQAIDVPALIVFGGLDRGDNLDVDTSAQRLRSLEDTSIEILIEEGLDHGLRAPGKSQVDADVMERVTGFALGD